MTRLFWLLTIMLVAGCAAPPPPPPLVITPPQAYYYLSPMPVVPGDDATELQLVNYLYNLHDAAMQCRQQVQSIQQWTRNKE